MQRHAREGKPTPIETLVFYYEFHCNACSRGTFAPIDKTLKDIPFQHQARILSKYAEAKKKRWKLLWPQNPSRAEIQTLLKKVERCKHCKALFNEMNFVWPIGGA